MRGDMCGKWDSCTVQPYRRGGGHVRVKVSILFPSLSLSLSFISTSPPCESLRRRLAGVF